MRNVMISCVVILACFAELKAQEWGDWTTLYEEGYDKFQISFKINGCSTDPTTPDIKQSYWKFNNPFTRPGVWIKGKFEYEFCSGGIKTEPFAVSLEKSGVLASSGNTSMGVRRIIRVYDVTYSDYARGITNKPVSGSSSLAPSTLTPAVGSWSSWKDKEDMSYQTQPTFGENDYRLSIRFQNKSTCKVSFKFKIEGTIASFPIEGFEFPFVEIEPNGISNTINWPQSFLAKTDFRVSVFDKKSNCNDVDLEVKTSADTKTYPIGSNQASDTLAKNGRQDIKRFEPEKRTEIGNNNPNNLSQTSNLIADEELRKQQVVGGRTGIMTYEQAEQLGNSVGDLSDGLTNKKMRRLMAERDFENEKSFGFTISAYTKAIFEEDIETLNKMLGSGMSVLTKVNGNVMNGLHYSSNIGNIKMCDFFLKKGIDINVPTNCKLSAGEAAFNNSPCPFQKDWTPLCYAVVSGRLDAVKFLLDKGADPNIIVSTGYGKTTISKLAQKSDQFYILRILEDWEKSHPRKNP